MMILFLGLVSIFLIPKWLQHRQDLRAGQVNEITGYIRKRTNYRGKKRSHGYEILVHDRVFTVKSKTFDAFVEGWRYTVYYTPFSKTIVAAEVNPDF